MAINVEVEPLIQGKPIHEYITARIKERIDIAKAEMKQIVRAAIRVELGEQCGEGSGTWIDKDGLDANADLVQIDGLLDIEELTEAISDAVLGLE